MATQEPMTTRDTRDMTPREREQAQREQQQSQRRAATRRRDNDEKTVYAKGSTTGEWPFVQAKSAEEQDAMVNSDGSNTVDDNSQETASSRATRVANEGGANAPRATAPGLRPGESYAQAQARQQQEADAANKTASKTSS